MHSSHMHGEGTWKWTEAGRGFQRGATRRGSGGHLQRKAPSPLPRGISKGTHRQWSGRGMAREGAILEFLEAVSALSCLPSREG